MFGALCVPLAFLTVREAVPHRFNAALLAGVLVLCGMFSLCPSVALRASAQPNVTHPSLSTTTTESSLLTISRFILLDPILLFFIQAATYFNFAFGNQRRR